MKSQIKFKGVISAMPTPFINNLVDYNSLKKMIEYQLKNGINGFVVNGTTAESPTLNWDEVVKIYHLTREISGTSVTIILGTGTNSTSETIDKTKKAEELGADAALVVVPYYNKPPQRGLIEHFKTVAASSHLPVILYNVPGRTITSMTTDTIVKLSLEKNIFAIKEASGDIAFDTELKKRLADNFILLSGDDPTYSDFLKIGGHGLISVMSNILTAECSRWTKLAAEEKWTDLDADFLRYKKIISMMYLEANPIPLKWMLYKKGIFATPEMRLPLMPLAVDYHMELLAEMKTLGCCE